MLVKLKSKSHGCNIIAREIALLLGDAAFLPAVYSHIPGISNKIADELSRKYAPGHVFSLPAVLNPECEVSPPTRHAAFYMCFA